METIELHRKILGVTREFAASAQAMMAASGWLPVTKDDEKPHEEPPTFTAEESMALGAKDAPKATKKTARVTGEED